MNKKRFLKFYFSNITVVLFSSLFIVWGLKGSIQERFVLIKEGGRASVNLIFQILILFILGFVSACLVYKLFRLESVEKTESKKNGLLVSGWILYFLALFFLVAKKWAQDRFPMHTPEIVYFTLTNIQGSFDVSIISESVRIAIYCFIFSLVQFFISFILGKRNTGVLKASFSKKSFSFSIGLVYLIWGIGTFSLMVLDLYKDLKVPEYIQIVKLYNSPAKDSQIYLNEYIVPSDKTINFPEKKKNLILIFMESMESSFADIESGGLLQKNLITNLTHIAEENINFSNTNKLGGGIDLAGTGWTVAGMTAKLVGLPFNMIGDENQNTNSFLPNAVTLTDILAQNGYRQLFLFGSDKHFASRDILLETHGDVEIHDVAWYKNNNLLPMDYSTYWGFEDLKLFNFARYELGKMNIDEPFMLGLLTVDTHMPEGGQCERCPTDEEMPLKNAIKCSDNLISEFLDWCKEQDWYANTTIVLVGDHLFMATEDTNPFDTTEYLTAHRLKSELDGMGDNPRRWLNIFINSSVTADDSRTRNRKFSSFDIFPTILAAMGCEIEGDRLGFGVNLFSNEATLCERFDEEYINKEIMSNNIQYRNLEFGKN